MVSLALLVLSTITFVKADHAVPPISSVQEPEPVIPYDFPETDPTKQTMVQLFEWKWTDIAKECEDFLQYYGYGAVQVSPPQEHVILYDEDGNIPWWIRYQPVSYKIISRDGSEEEFQDMVDRCNKVGVRVVVEAVLNNMVSLNLVYGVNGVSSSGGSYFDGTEGKESFPAVPYCHNDTNDYRCNRNIDEDDYKHSAFNVRVCRLEGLIDLNQDDECVQYKMIEYLNKLIAMGVAGFQFDAAEQIFPKNLQTIIYKLDNLREDIFGKNQRPFCVHHVIDLGHVVISAEEYFVEKMGRYTDFDYGIYISNIIWRTPSEMYKSFGDLQWWGAGYGYGEFKSTHVLAFIDNQDTQREGSVLTYKNGNQYALATGFMLSWNYGYPRVMSSFYFSNQDQGPPHLDNNAYEIKSPEFDTTYKTCLVSSGWVCEHRWQAVRGMALFRHNVVNTTTTIQYTEGQLLAFSRDGKGFFAANNGNTTWSISTSSESPSSRLRHRSCHIYSSVYPESSVRQYTRLSSSDGLRLRRCALADIGHPGQGHNRKIQTKLPPGLYCEVWSGEVGSDNKCTGEIIFVNTRGFAYVEVPTQQFVAMHVGAMMKGCDLSNGFC